MITSGDPSTSRPRLEWPLLLLIAAAPFVVLLVCITQYGWFRDEIYYVACADHPAMGYVDHPPLSIWLLGAWRALVGEHLGALRLLPALVMPAWVVLTGALARELGGGRGAQLLAALAAATVPTALGTAHVFSMNAFDMVVWPTAMLLFLRASETGSPRAWLGLGFALGLGLLDKISVLWLGAGLVAALILTPGRRRLATPWPFLAALIAGLVAFPYLWWERRHGFPTLEFMRNATGMKMVGVSVLEFVKGQLMSMGPWTNPVWIVGLVAGLVPRTSGAARSIAITYLTIVIILIVAGHSRSSYALPAYPALLACGAWEIERSLHGVPLRIVRAVLVSGLVLGGALGALLALPLLPVDSYIRFSRAVGVAPSTEEHLQLGSLPQHLADMFGWQELADHVAAIYRSLSPEDRANCVIFAQNYGEASAVAVLGRRYGLPRVLSGHNSYWMWGPGHWRGQIMIIVGSNLHDNAQWFDDVRQVGTSTSPYAMPYERDLPIFVGRRFKYRLAEAWPRMRMFI